MNSLTTIERPTVRKQHWFCRIGCVRTEQGRVTSKDWYFGAVTEVDDGAAICAATAKQIEWHEIVAQTALFNVQRVARGLTSLNAVWPSVPTGIELSPIPTCSDLPL